MSVAFGFHPAAVALSLVLAGVLTWWTYRITIPPVSTIRRTVLMALRWTSLSLVLLLLAEPVVRSLARSSEDPVVAVLFDTSRSLSLDVHPDIDHSAAVRLALDEVSEAADGANVETYRFGAALERWAPVDADTGSFDGSRTDMAAALESVRSAYIGRPLRGVVLMSDGRYNTGGNPLYVAERYPVPIHTVIVGDTTAYRDLRIERVATNEVGYVDRELPVQVTLHAKGFADRVVVVSLSGPGIDPVDANVRFGEEETEVAVDLVVTPTSEGFHSLEAAVDVLAGERTGANNKVSFGVRVMERKLTILLIAAGPSPDVAAVREMLESDSDLEVEAYTQKSSSTWYEGSPPPKSLDRFDAIMLAGYPGRYAEPSVLDAVTESDKPVLFLLDRTTDLRLVRDRLERVLPASVRTVRSGFIEAAPVQSPVGRTHPILSLPGEIDRLPPVAYSSSRWEATPDARTLATVSVRGVVLDEPLLVVRTRSGTRSAAILGAGIWRWRNVPTDLADLDQVFPELVSNLLQWITTKSDDRPVRVKPVEELFDGTDAVQFTGEVYDESLDPVSDASLVLSVMDSTGATLEYHMETLGSGRYSKLLSRLPEGSYRYRAVAEVSGEPVGADSGHFAVGELSLEFLDTEADVDLMRNIARRSGGAFLHFGELRSLGERLSEAESLAPVVTENEVQLPLRRMVPFLFAIVALLSAEWVIRKRSGMV